MDRFLDVDNNNEPNGSEGRENNFQQWIRQLVSETIDQYATDIAALFRRVIVGENQYHESMKAQIFVQELCSDLALAVGLFMPRTLQEAIKRAQVSELALSRNITIQNPLPFISPLVSYFQQPIIRMNQPILTNSIEDPVKKLTLLMEEIVVLLEHVSWKCPDSNQDSGQRLNNNERQRPEERNMNNDKNRPTVDGESAFISKNHLDEPTKEVYTANRRKGNDGEATEVKKPELVKKNPKIMSIEEGKSSGCVVSVNFLKEVRISIDHPSTVLMIGVHGKRKRPLGEVDEFTVTVEEKTITSCAVISDAKNYAIIIGNDQLKKARTRLDWEEYEPTSDKETESESKEEEEYEDESLINETYFYMKLQEANDELIICGICSKVGHDKDLSICPLTMEQEVKIENLLEEYKEIFNEEIS
ncbi:hypothetical protein C2G38_2193803 [Gigaspora rosea]|uniref:Uncharacterized protein n=1 Tax=Gigaspora rosea TaxID=44941 RepID=A0A397UXK8_9GLOM|nr:hypothetical protein C2G38_2193803 [Gigaspora rosea]